MPLPPDAMAYSWSVAVAPQNAAVNACAETVGAAFNVSDVDCATMQELASVTVTT